MGGVGAARPPIFSTLHESWSKVSHAARELATFFFVTVFLFLVKIVGHLVKRPHNRKCLGTFLLSPMFSGLQENWSKVSHAARELATVFSMALLATIVG